MGKKIYKTCGRVIAIVAVILCCFSAKASTVRVLIGDLWYVLDESKLTAAVVREELEEGDDALVYNNAPRNDQYLNLVGDIEIPKRVSYKGSKYTVTSIAPFAFYRARNLTSVTIANTVTNIGAEAFCYCSGLKKVKIRDAVDVVIQRLAFSNCTSLTSIILPSRLKYMGLDAFSNCKALESVTWNAKNCEYWCWISAEEGDLDGITSYDQVSAFRGCENISSFVFGEEVETIPNGLLCYDGYNKHFSKIKEIVIPNSVTSIGYGAFTGCDSLCNLVIGESLSNIGEIFSKIIGQPFSCKNLESITVNEFNKNFDSRNNCNAIIETETNTLRVGSQNTIIPSSVTSIGDMAFYYCSGLESIKIPSSVTSIGSYAFYPCYSLKSVYTDILRPEKVELSDAAFNYYKGVSLHVPRGTAERYRAADGWRNFHKIVEDMINGDINGDEITDVSDVVAISNHVLGDVGTTIDSVIGDVNGSGAIDVADVVTLANYVLGE